MVPLSCTVLCIYDTMLRVCIVRSHQDTVARVVSRGKKGLQIVARESLTDQWYTTSYSVLISEAIRFECLV